MTRTAANALALARPRAVRRAPVPCDARPGAAATAFPAATARPMVQRLFRGVTGTGGIFQFSR